MASITGSYIEAEIEQLPEKLVKSPVYGQCVASDTGSYIETEATKSPVELDGTSM